MITLYQGQNVHNNGSKYYTPEKEWARQFTQSGQDKEIKTITFPEDAIYKKNPLPFATSDKDFDTVLSEAKVKGFRAFWLDEGVGEPNSVYLL